jgi:hypothetical protein
MLPAAELAVQGRRKSSKHCVQVLCEGGRWIPFSRSDNAACMYDMTYAIVAVLAALALTQLVKINRPL